MNAKEAELRKRVASAVSKTKETVTRDPYRLRFHISPPTGLLNDPNGLIHFKGLYHVFYQWNPFAMEHGPKFWAHLTSQDLVHWEEQKYALSPSEWYEKDGCYSGSAIEHDSRLYLLYTGNVKDMHGNRETYQCLAVSEDGIHFEKRGPVLRLPDQYTAHFRDPKVWKKGNLFYMIVGAQTKDHNGAAALFSSPDLVDWTHIGPLTTEFGSFGYMWECPDVFRLNDKDIFMFSPQGLERQPFKFQNLYQSGYCTGELDYRTGAFRHTDFQELDYGFDFYAPQTFEDEKGRRLLFAWMGAADGQESSHPTANANWVHALTLPRELKRAGDNVLQLPVEETKKWRHSAIADSQIGFTSGKPYTIQGTCMEILLDKLSFDGAWVSIDMRGHLTFTYNKETKTALLRRLNPIDQTWEERACKLEKLEKLHIFLDVSSAELFLNGGEITFTSRYFPDEKNEDITLTAQSSASFGLQIWGLSETK